MSTTSKKARLIKAVGRAPNVWPSAPALPIAETSEIQPIDIHRYLGSHDWKRLPYPTEQLFLFQASSLFDDDGTPCQLLVPGVGDYIDFPPRIAQTVESISIIEDRPLEKVIRDILKTRSAK